MKKILSALLIMTSASALCATPLDKPKSKLVPIMMATGTLNGTLEMPAGKGPFPVALIIAGSGPTDRDGNDAQLGLHTDSYKLLAEALAKNGIASLRYDKRGVGEDATLVYSEADLRFENYIEDAVGWGKQLRGDKRFSTVTIIGHSEGSLIGLVAVREFSADAYVSLAGAGESAQVLILKQLNSIIPPDLYHESETIITSLEQGKTVANVPVQLNAMFRTSVQPYLISWFRYDPAVEISKLKIPALIIQGERDLQVTVADAQALVKADPSAKLVLIPTMNHTLKDVGDSRKDNEAAYNNPKLPIDTTLVTSISDFIEHLPSQRGVAHVH